jgi:hypothetical protein
MILIVVTRSTQYCILLKKDYYLCASLYRCFLASRDCHCSWFICLVITGTERYGTVPYGTSIIILTVRYRTVRYLTLPSRTGTGNIPLVRYGSITIPYRAVRYQYGTGTVPYGTVPSVPVPYYIVRYGTVRHGTVTK